MHIYIRIYVYLYIYRDAHACKREGIVSNTRIYSRPVPHVHPQREQQERGEDGVRFITFLRHRTRPRSPAISCVAVIEYLKMSGSVQDGGEGRKGDGVREWNRDGKIVRYYYTGLETMPRIKNAARLRKINTAPSLSLSLSFL